MATTLAPIGLTPAQLADRRNGIGASEVGAVLGLDKYRSPLDVWAYKTGRVEQGLAVPSQAAKMGHLLEPIVAQLAEETYVGGFPTCAVTLDASDTVVGRAAWHRATPDRLVTIEGAGLYDRFLLECKTKSWNTFKEFGAPGTDEVPDSIALQALWQMDVTGLRRCDVAVLVDGREFALYRIPFDADLAQDVFDRVGDWWERYVVADVEPPVSRASDLHYLQRKFKQATAGILPSTQELEELTAALLHAKEAKEAAEAEEARLKAALMQHMGSYTNLHTRAGKISWTEQKGRPTTDWKGIIADLEVPEELIATHTRTGEPSRVFRFTPSKGDN